MGSTRARRREEITDEEVIVQRVFDASRFRDVLTRRAAGAIAPEEASPKAAVAAIFQERAGEIDVLLIRRSKSPNDPWSGHMAFPGGRMERSDPGLLETAYRETFEEIGLDLRTHADMLGRLDDLWSTARGRRSGLIIAPFIFLVRPPFPPLILNNEVEAVVWASLAPLWSGEAATTLPYGDEGCIVELPALRVGQDVVWGLTHRMLQDMFTLLDAACEGGEP